jgi:trehalose synthase
VYLATGEHNAARLDEEYDVVFIHDPQPAALPALRGKGNARCVWRCHIDTSHPNLDVWEFLRPFLEVYDAAIFTMKEFVPPAFPLPRVEIIPPAIDPLSPKNFPLANDIARQVLNWIGVRVDRPLITQVARFDPWKDPLGVIAAYRLVRQDLPTLQLAMVGSMALDDPEGWEIYRQIAKEAEADPQIHVFTNLTGVGNIEVNAFQRLSSVVVQKSIREGFGLVVSEALWKGTPVVAGRAGGIPLQMADGVGGSLVGSVRSARQQSLSCCTTRREHVRSPAVGRSASADTSCCPASC